jgi:beta-glucosidase
VRASLPIGARLSLVLNLAPVRATGTIPADEAAVRRVDGLQNRLFLDPVLRGSYPADVVSDTGRVSDWDFVRDGDLAAIAEPLDLLGVNYYRPALVSAGEPTPRTVNGRRPTQWPGCADVRFHQPPGPVTHMGWSVDASGLRELLLRLRRDYGDVPLVITENGAAYDDRPTGDGAVHDPERIAFLRAHLAAVHDALRAGVDVRGYFVWSLLDNFEWAYGYGKRFGIVHVGYATQRRTLKDSAHWYRDVIAEGGRRMA